MHLPHIARLGILFGKYPQDIAGKAKSDVPARREVKRLRSGCDGGFDTAFAIGPDGDFADTKQGMIGHSARAPLNPNALPTAGFPRLRINMGLAERQIANRDERPEIATELAVS